MALKHAQKLPNPTTTQVFGVEKKCDVRGNIAKSLSGFVGHMEVSGDDIIGEGSHTFEKLLSVGRTWD